MTKHRKIFNPGYAAFLIVSLLFTGCDAPEPQSPKGFEAVVPVDTNSGRVDCPSISGTYLYTGTHEQNMLLEKSVDPKEFSFFVLESPKKSQTYSYKLQIKSVPAYAEGLKNSDSDKYELWRKSILKLNDAYSEQNLAEVLKYGLPFEYHGELRQRSCNLGWMTIKTIETKMQNYKSGEGYVQTEVVSVARDKYGDLLIHVTTLHSQRSADWSQWLWAGNGATVQMVPVNDQWGKMHKVADKELPSDWSEANLQTTKESPHDQCRTSEVELANFVQRKNQSNFIIEKQNPSSLINGNCKPASLLLGISSSNSKEAAEEIELLKKDSSVRQVEILSKRVQNDKLYSVIEISF